jgi:hypothetical protein
MADGKYIAIDANGNKVEEQAANTSAGVADASKIVRLNSSGLIDDTMIPGLEGVTLTASEDLDAGELVNIWDDAGTASMRKADASGNKPADGFVSNSVVLGETATMYGEGKISGLSGLTVGATYFLSASTPGDAVDTAPTGTGNILQKVGRAASATTLIFERGETIERI